MNRRVLLGAALGLLLYPMRAFAALTDAQAMVRAIRDFGPRAMIGHWRRSGDSNWTKAVGYWNGFEFIPLGKGFNTWDAAFSNVPSGAAVGPVVSNSITIGRLVVLFDAVERARFEQELKTQYNVQSSFVAGPIVAGHVQRGCEERLSDMIQEMLARHTIEMTELMNLHGVQLTNDATRV